MVHCGEGGFSGGGEGESGNRVFLRAAGVGVNYCTLANARWRYALLPQVTTRPSRTLTWGCRPSGLSALIPLRGPWFAAAVSACWKVLYVPRRPLSPLLFFLLVPSRRQKLTRSGKLSQTCLEPHSIPLQPSKGDKRTIKLAWKAPCLSWDVQMAGAR